jgi:hypothetical protein
VLWWWEEEGNTGKSWFASYLKALHEARILDVGKKADMAYMLRGHRGNITVFNLARSHDPEKINYMYGFIETIKDNQVVSTKYEPCEVPLKPQHVVVFANVPPNESAWSEDRYRTKRIDTTTPWSIAKAAMPAVPPVPPTNAAAEKWATMTPSDALDF